MACGRYAVHDSKAEAAGIGSATCCSAQRAMVGVQNLDDSLKVDLDKTVKRVVVCVRHGTCGHGRDVSSIELRRVVSFFIFTIVNWTQSTRVHTWYLDVCKTAVCGTTVLYNSMKPYGTQYSVLGAEPLSTLSRSDL